MEEPRTRASNISIERLASSTQSEGRSEQNLLVLAQQQADETGRTVTLIIIGLLVVAVLLAALTYWYWRHTDPRNRGRSPIPEPIDGTSATAPIRHERPADTGARRRAADSSADRALLEEDEAEEWLRLTGPEALQRKI